MVQRRGQTKVLLWKCRFNEATSLAVKSIFAISNTMFGEVKQANACFGAKIDIATEATHFTIAIANPKMATTKWRREMRFRTSLQNTV